jgi:hypothetical protein
MSIGRSVAVFGAGAALIAGACTESGEKGGVPMTSMTTGEEVCATALEAAQQQSGFEVFTQPLEVKINHEYSGDPPVGVGSIALRDCYMLNPSDGVALRLEPFFRAIDRPDGQVGVDFALSEEHTEYTAYSLEDTDLSGMDTSYADLGELPGGLLSLTCDDGEVPVVSLEGVTERADPNPAIGDIDQYTVNLMEGAQFGCADEADVVFYVPPDTE